MSTTIAMPAQIRKDLADNAQALLTSSTVSGALRTFVAWCVAAADRRRQRYILSTLDERLLSDIGLTRGQASFESSKPFWRE